MAESVYSPCQEKALKLLLTSKENIFLTGHAGTGKSFLIRHFLKNKDRKEFPVLASTGAAAVLVSGRTLHSFFGLGIMEGGVEKTVERALDNKRVVKRLKEIEGFVLDEVSMISGPTLRAAEMICRLARKIKAPWGGARVIATGDFAQLPPVNPKSRTREWAFLDETWERTEFTSIVLQTIMRSKDEEYTTILNLVREGIVDDQVREYLNRKTDVDSIEDQASHSTYLFPHREHADRLNLTRLAAIKHPLQEIPTVYTGDERGIETLKKQSPIPDVLSLKKTALVMLRINDPSYKFVNGTLATLLDIRRSELVLELGNKRMEVIEKHTFSVQDADGKEIATACNFPVSLAYASTIHKSQGATIDQMTCDLRNLWEPGHAYVALSRLRSGKGLTLVGWDESSIRVDPQVVAFHQKLASV